jgi:hypothetical protein
VSLPRRRHTIDGVIEAEEKFSDQLERWFAAGRPRLLGDLVALFEEKGFAVAFIVLLAPSALPLPTGGVTNVLEVVAMLLALELVAGRRTVWLPRRWQRVELGASAERFGSTLARRIRWVERYSKPRLRVLLNRRVSGIVFGALVLVLTLGAFLAPPFSGLDTLPSLGVVLLALGVLFEDSVLALAGIVVGALGVLLVIALGSLVVDFVGGLL